MTAAARLAGLVQTVTGVAPNDLPLGIRAWDGSVAGPVGRPVLVVRNRRALRRLVWAPGELGLARAYVTRDLHVDGDLADALRRVWRLAREHPLPGARVRPHDWVRLALEAARLGALGLPPRAPAGEAGLRGRRHSRRRDRAAIAHHYNLSNDFFALLLDDTLAYSAAYFTAADQTLRAAQHAKLHLICRKLGLRPGQRLLDVGCGWGALVVHAAEHYGVRATGITLSERQRDFASKRLADRGLTDRVEVRLQDYRELCVDSAFDAVSSIEMGEHVGEEHYSLYARTLYRSLKPTGRLLLQQMSRRRDAAPGGGAFIERYIAPDMHMRPMSETLGHLENAGFEVRDVQSMREHYVRTVRAWITTLEQHWDEFVAQTDEQTVRIWRLYLVGGALSFEEGRMGVDQFLAVRPTADGRSGMPAGRPEGT